MNGQWFVGFDGVVVFEYGVVGCCQGGYLVEYFVYIVLVDGVVDMFEWVNICVM